MTTSRPLYPNEQIDVTKLVEAIELILPLAKGYSDYHPEVKSSYRYIDIARELLRKYYGNSHDSPTAEIPDTPAERDWSEVADRLVAIYNAHASTNGHFRAEALRILREADKPVMVKQMLRRWVNIYPTWTETFATRECAYISRNPGRLACKEIEIEYTPGEGL